MHLYKVNKHNYLVINLRKIETLKATLSQGSYVLCSLLLILSTFADQMYAFVEQENPLSEITQNRPVESCLNVNNLPLVKVNKNLTTPLPLLVANWFGDNFDSSLVFQQYESWEGTGKIFGDTNLLKP